MKWKNLLKLMVLLVVVTSCASSSYQISDSNLADLYRETEKTLLPEFVVFHENENTSTLYMRLESSNLLYTKTLDKGNFTARVRFTYMLFESYTSSRIVDSASVVIEDINDEMINKEIIANIRMEAKYPNLYVLKVTARDMNKGKEESQFISVDKTSKMGRQNFLVRDEETGSVQFRRKLGERKKLRITYGDPLVKRVAVKYYNRNFPLTPPPFAVYAPKRFDFTPDSMHYAMMDDSNSFVLDIQKMGMFHIQTDSASKEGLTLIRFEDHYPDLRMANQMIEPMRFITTNREYEDISENPFPRDGVEEYWLTVSSSPDRARELIRAFYNRVEDANRFFSTHIQGWKSDRGIIYIIYGPPEVIYKSAQGESWIYGNKSQTSLTFNFNMTYNPFSANDMRLERNPEYKSYWYRAVDTWRQGRVYKY